MPPSYTFNFESLLIGIGNLVAQAFTYNSVQYFYNFYNGVRFVATFFCIILFALLVYVEIQLHKMHEHEHHEDHEMEHYQKHRAHAKAELAPANPRWEKIKTHVESENPSDWRLAILEADIVLEEMLEKMSYHGDTVAEKLKSVEPADFTSLNSAWEAHKIRNLIAHEGSDFLISEREAKRVIGLYETVFREFHFI